MKSSNNNKTLGAVIVCAGKGERTGLPYNKVLHVLGNKTVLERVLDTFCECGFSRIAVVASADDISRITEIVSEYVRNGVDTAVTLGGNTRAESVRNGLKACPCDIVAIHDGARPYATKELVLRTIESAKRYGSGVAAVRSVDTVKRRTADGKVQSLPRNELFNMQTPQTFAYADIVIAYSGAPDTVTDDAEAFELWGGDTVLVDGEYTNIKITTPADLGFGVSASARIGAGYDVHRLVEGRKLILGGVEIPYERGLLGHSDADVLTHAIMDALLSAAGLPDIGVLFPDTDDKYLGIASAKLLADVVSRVKDCGYGIGNVSAVVIAERPKLAAHIPAIRAALAASLGIEVADVNVSATTAEGLGIVGNGEAIAVNAACVLTERTDR